MDNQQLGKDETGMKEGGGSESEFVSLATVTALPNNSRTHPGFFPRFRQFAPLLPKTFAFLNFGPKTTLA